MQFLSAGDPGELQFQGTEAHRLLMNAQQAGWHSKQLGDGGVFAETSQTFLHSHTPAQAKAELDIKIPDWWNFGLPGYFTKRKFSGLKVEMY